MNDKLKTELNRFWEWAGMTKEEYSQTPDFGDWENGYPYWSDIYCEAEKTINLISTNKVHLKMNEIITVLLEAIAIDNNNEKIIKDCKSVVGIFPEFSEIAIVHQQPEARRQVAELMGKIGDSFFINYLRLMVNDKVNYVQRSALLSIAKIIPNEAEEIAFGKISENDEYIKLFSLRLLKELSSSWLAKAVEALQYDESILIQHEIKEMII